MKFRSVKTGSSSSTTVGQELASELLGRAVEDWRGESRGVFRELTRREFSDGGLDIMKRGLELLAHSVVDADGVTIDEVVANAWKSGAEEVITVEWRGSGPNVALEDLSAKAQTWVDSKLAEPGFMLAATETPELTGNSGLLFALAAGAECAPTRLWVAAGGTLAPVMRPNPAKWHALLSSASAEARVLVPIRRSALDGGEIPTTIEAISAVAGLDVIEDVALISGWLGSLVDQTHEDFPMILAGFGYSAGASHVILQAAQDALMSVASQNCPHVVLAWLGTPTDSLLTPRDLFDDRARRHASRSALTKIRDAVLDALGGELSRPPLKDLVEYKGNEYSLLDCSADMQGPNYLIAKRSQRWRAMVASAAGIKVAYCLTPAARTHSVLDFRILRSTYRGAPRFGVVPFTVADTQQLTARLLLSYVHIPIQSTDASDVYLARAVHGGLWRCCYNPQSIWKPATVIGWPALLRRGF